MRYRGAIIIVLALVLWGVLLNGLAGGGSGNHADASPGASDGGFGTATATATATGPAAGATVTPAAAGSATATATASDNVYFVKAGDTMAKIAKDHGVSLQALLAANPQISDPTQIHVGQEINLPH